MNANELAFYILRLFSGFDRQCPGYQVVYNGLLNFSLGVDNIGGFTNVLNYLFFGLDYILKSC